MLKRHPILLAVLWAWIVVSLSPPLYHAATALSFHDYVMVQRASDRARAVFLEPLAFDADGDPIGHDGFCKGTTCSAPDWVWRDQLGIGHDFPYRSFHERLAQLPWQPGFGTPKTAAAYVGPNDITGVSFTAWYSCTRGVSAAKATANANACDLRRASDNATCTVKLAASGGVDLMVGTPCGGSTVTAWIGASSALISKVYDQTAGNACITGTSCDAIETTAALQPQLLLTGCGVASTLPCITAATSQNMLTPFADRFVSTNGIVSFSAVSDAANAAGGAYIIAYNNGSWLGGGGSANQWRIFDGTTVKAFTANDATWHAANTVITTGASLTVVNLDGTETTFTLAPVANTSQIVVLAGSGSAGIVMNGGEAGFADNVVWTSTVRGKLCANQAAYYGTTVGATCS